MESKLRNLKNKDFYSCALRNVKDCTKIAYKDSQGK